MIGPRAEFVTASLVLMFATVRLGLAVLPDTVSAAAPVRNTTAKEPPQPKARLNEHDITSVRFRGLDSVETQAANVTSPPNSDEPIRQPQIAPIPVLAGTSVGVTPTATFLLDGQPRILTVNDTVAGYAIREISRGSVILGTPDTVVVVKARGTS